MFSELKSVSFMGVVSNSEMILSEKDLNSLEFGFFVRPPLEFEDECHIAPLQDKFDQQLDKEEEVQRQEQDKGKQENKWEILVSNLEVKLPSLGGGEFRINQDKAEDEDEDEDDGFKTPTSLDHKIPSPVLTCPPAPRKPKSFSSTKRKSSHLTAIPDLSDEIESLFPPALLADLGGKIKKVRQGNDTK